MTKSARSEVLPAALTVAAVALIVGLFGHALFDFAQQREKTGSRSKIVIAMINALPDRDDDARFTPVSAQASLPQPVTAAVAKPLMSSASPGSATPSHEGKMLAEIEQIQRKWARLWSQRDAQGFLKLYDPAFPELERYAETRTRRINAAKDISVDIQDLTLVAAGPETVIARFTQHYRSDAYQDSVMKELVWKRGADGYRVIAEKTVK